MIKTWDVHVKGFILLHFNDILNTVHLKHSTFAATIVKNCVFGQNYLCILNTD